MACKDRIVMSIGGSLVVPNGGIDTKFLSELNAFIREQLAKNPNRQFFLVIGGGSTAGHYIDAGKKVIGGELTRDDLDWLGIHTTKLNAHLVRTIFRDIDVLKNANLIPPRSSSICQTAPCVSPARWTAWMRSSGGS